MAIKPLPWSRRHSQVQKPAASPRPLAPYPWPALPLAPHPPSRERETAAAPRSHPSPSPLLPLVLVCGKRPPPPPLPAGVTRAAFCRWICSRSRWISCSRRPLLLVLACCLPSSRAAVAKVLTPPEQPLRQGRCQAAPSIFALAAEGLAARRDRQRRPPRRAAARQRRSW